MLRLTHTPALRPAPAGSGESRWRGALAVASAPQGACPLPVHGLTCAARSHRPLLRHRHGRPRNSSGPGGPLFSSSSSSLYGHSSQLPFNDCISDKKHEEGAQPMKVSSCSPPVSRALRSIACRLLCSRAVRARRCGSGRRADLPEKSCPTTDSLMTVARVTAGDLRGGSGLPSGGEGGAKAAATARDALGGRWRRARRAIDG